jgi:hypothetical protein
LLHVRAVRLSLRKAVSKKVYRQGFGNRCRATPQADIWIHRLSGQEIDKAALVGGYCRCFCSSSIAGSRILRRQSRQFT